MTISSQIINEDNQNEENNWTIAQENHAHSFAMKCIKMTQLLDKSQRYYEKRAIIEAFVFSIFITVLSIRLPIRFFYISVILMCLFIGRYCKLHNMAQECKDISLLFSELAKSVFANILKADYRFLMTISMYLYDEILDKHYSKLPQPPREVINLVINLFDIILFLISFYSFIINLYDSFVVNQYLK